MERAKVGAQIVDRLRAALPDAAAATVAAALSWLLAKAIFGHPQPVFAAVTAIICLAPGLPNHGRQAVGLVLGVATGILVGEAALLVPDVVPTLRLSLATFVAILIASGYGLQAVVPIQAGVSALLVLALGSGTAGVVRMLDVGCGTAVGLLFSQVLFTPDPVRHLWDGERALLSAIAEAFRQAGSALASGNQSEAQAALRTFSDAHERLIALAGGIDTARSAATWSLRGRLVRRDVRFVAGRFGRRSTRTYAAALLFGSALATAMQRRPEPPPKALAPGIAAAIQLCDVNQQMRDSVHLPLAGVHDDWRRCLVRLDEAMEAIRALRESEVGAFDHSTADI
jgi:uncharacterized membrane protein YgaE (UPF0421/DUF939 family)